MILSRLTPSFATRRGQTLVLAIGVLFLLMVVGAIFVGMVGRNLFRENRGRRVSRAESLAWAGVEFAAEQFKTSLNGADWRPVATEDLWRHPDIPAGDPQRTQKLAARQQDPDASWLDPAQNSNQPYIRFASGEGRFLLRITYEPTFRQQLPQNGTFNYPYPHAFDPNSMLIHIESVGRPGIVDPNDPTTLRDTTNTANADQPRGEFKKIEAWVPIGLVDQLLWITNRRGERGPATLGVGPLRGEGIQPLVTAPSTGGPTDYQIDYYDDDPDDGRDDTGTSYFGGIRSAVDLRILGDLTWHLFPARGEQVAVNGKIDHFRSGNRQARVKVVLHDDSNDPNFVDEQNDNYAFAINQIFQGDSDTRTGPQPFNPILDPNPGVPSYLDGRGSYLDSKYLESSDNPSAESIRAQGSPSIDQVNPATGVLRYVQLTRDSGEEARVTADGEQRSINTGWYGYAMRVERDPAGAVVWRNADWANPNSADPNWPYQHKGPQGLYLDNLNDIQYPGDRSLVVDEWMQSGESSANRQGWVGPIYVPSVSERVSGRSHPIAELTFTQIQVDQVVRNSGTQTVSRPVDVVMMRRYDPDVRKLTFGGAAGRTRNFYAPVIDAQGQVTSYTPVGPTAYFLYPANGVIFCEGSVRVRGRIPAGKQLTVVSGGTVYIEGNLLRGDRSSMIGLLASDYVCLNPTQFIRMEPGPDVGVPEPDRFSVEAKRAQIGWHWALEENADFDLFVQNAIQPNVPPLGPRNNGCAYVLHLEHTAQAEDVHSRGGFQLFRVPPGFGGVAFGQPGNTVDLKGFPPISSANVPPFTYSDRVDPRCMTSDAQATDLDRFFYHFFFFPPPSNRGDQALRDLQLWNQSNSLSQRGGSINYERKSIWIPHAGSGPNAVLDPTAGAEQHLKFWVPPSAHGQPYWLSRAALMPYGEPLKIRVEAVMYAQNRSWFVIPPPWFNVDPDDSRSDFRQRAQVPLPGQPRPVPSWRAAGTKPANDGTYPFFEEPLNIDIEIRGAITENMPAEPAHREAWTRRLWMKVPEIGATTPVSRATFDQETPGFRPRMRYFYEHDLRRWVRYRIVNPAANPAPGPAIPPLEGVAYTAPVTPNTAPAPILAGNATPPLLANVIQAARQNYNGYVITMPLLPKLPAGPVLYEGTPVQ